MTESQDTARSELGAARDDSVEVASLPGPAERGRDELLERGLALLLTRDVDILRRLGEA